MKARFRKRDMLQFLVSVLKINCWKSVLKYEKYVEINMLMIVKSLNEFKSKFTYIKLILSSFKLYDVSDQICATCCLEMCYSIFQYFKLRVL